MAMPIKSAIAMYVFAIYSATLLGYISTELLSFPTTVTSLLKAIFPGVVQ
jgi:type III secretory pathway component EscT